MFIFLSRALRSLAPSPMFSKRTKRKIKQHLCTGYFHTVKRMSAPDEAHKMLCIIASLEFFSCVSTQRLLFHHNCPVRSQRLCVKGRFLCSIFLTRNLNGLVRVGTQGLFRPCLKTFVAPFSWTRLTAPGSPRMNFDSFAVERVLFITHGVHCAFCLSNEPCELQYYI